MELEVRAQKLGELGRLKTVLHLLSAGCGKHPKRAFHPLANRDHPSARSALKELKGGFVVVDWSQFLRNRPEERQMIVGLAF